MSVDAATGQKTMLKKRKTKLKVGEEALEEQVSDSETSVRKKVKITHVSMPVFESFSVLFSA